MDGKGSLNMVLGVGLRGYAVLAFAACLLQVPGPVANAADSESLFLASWSMFGADLDIGSPGSVVWTLRYPLLFSAHSLADTAWADAAKAYEDGRLLEALIGLDRVPESARNANYHTYRAHLMLLSGSEDEARLDMDRAERLAPGAAEVAALRAILSLRQGRQEEAQAHAERAVTTAPNLAAAHLARSYAQQAGGDLAAAQASAKRVLSLDPSGAQGYIRVAELELAAGNSVAALASADRAVQLTPGLAQAHDTRGFALLGNDRPQEALASFGEAVRISAGDAIARFGLGLAHVRLGQRLSGREQLETAVDLSPGKALLHTYLGRAYDLEGRSQDAAAQFALADQADPRDPTPRRFESMRLAGDNSPVGARVQMQAALDRAAHRAVYRAPRLLAQDRALYLADRSALEAVLGLEEQSWLSAGKALAEAPGLGAAHLAAGDALASRSRGGLARQGEYLQAILREPLGGLSPSLLLAEGVQPGAVAPQQGFFRAALPEGIGFNEYGAVFSSAGPHLDVDVTAGNHATLGDQLRVAGEVGRVGLSLSQLHFQSDGFGSRDTLENTIWRSVLRYDPRPGSRVHLEYQHADGGRDGVLFPGDDLFNQPQHVEDKRERTRLALRHQFGGLGELILVASREDLDQQIDTLPTAGNLLLETRRDRQDVRSEILEGQFVWHGDAVRVIAGAGHYRDRQHFAFGPGEHVFGNVPPIAIDTSARTRSAYVYAQHRFRPNLTWEAGIVADDQALSGFTQRFVSPKLGLRWQVMDGATLSLAATRGLNRYVMNGASLEPTQVAGFQQLYNDGPGVRADRLGMGWEQRLAHGWEWGGQISGRELRVPLLGVLLPYDRWHEREARLWASRVLTREALEGWLPGWEGAVTLAYDAQDYTRHGITTGLEQIRDYRPQHLQLGSRLFNTKGWGVNLGLTWVQAEGTQQTLVGTRNRFEDAFPVLDAALTWRLPGRRGQLSVGALNLLDREYRYLEMDSAQPRLAPARHGYIRLRLGF